jgi:type IV pilus assembly protein PilM
MHGTGQQKVLGRYAYMPIDSKLALSDSKNDEQKLAQAIAQLLEQAKVDTKHVVAGIPSTRVFTTVADVDRLSQAELAQSIQFQADTLIPTPLAESKIDWALLGDSPADKTKVEILLSSVPNNYIERRLDMLESIGLDVIAFEPDNLALARALTSPTATGTQLILDLGFKTSDLVMMSDGKPKLARSVANGMEAIINGVSQNLSIDKKQAEQFINKFGLSKDKLEGQVANAMVPTVELLVGEIEKSIKFFQARYADKQLEKLIVTGGASVVPEFPLYLANRLKVNVEIGNAWGNVAYSADRQNELSALSHQFGVAVGLAERVE